MHPLESGSSVGERLLLLAVASSVRRMHGIWDGKKWDSRDAASASASPVPRVVGQRGIKLILRIRLRRRDASSSSSARICVSSRLLESKGKASAWFATTTRQVRRARGRVRRLISSSLSSRVNEGGTRGGEQTAAASASGAAVPPLPPV